MAVGGEPGGGGHRADWAPAPHPWGLSGHGGVGAATGPKAVDGQNSGETAQGKNKVGINGKS